MLHYSLPQDFREEIIDWNAAGHKKGSSIKYVDACREYKRVGNVSFLMPKNAITI